LRERSDSDRSRETRRQLYHVSSAPVWGPDPLCWFAALLVASADTEPR